MRQKEEESKTTKKSIKTPGLHPTPEMLRSHQKQSRPMPAPPLEQKPVGQDKLPVAFTYHLGSASDVHPNFPSRNLHTCLPSTHTNQPNQILTSPQPLQEHPTSQHPEGSRKGSWKYTPSLPRSIAPGFHSAVPSFALLTSAQLGSRP